MIALFIHVNVNLHCNSSKLVVPHEANKVSNRWLIYGLHWHLMAVTYTFP